MDFLSSALKKNSKPDKEEADEQQQQNRPPPSSSELLSSAKVVGEAAKSTFSHETDKVDKGKVAGAGADLLGAASEYGKLDENKGIGQYVEKAETYLHQHSSTTTASTEPPKSDQSTTKPSTTGGDQQESGGGYGDYLKMAEGFVKKN